MNRYTLVALSLSLLAIGCKKDLEPQESSVAPTTDAATAATSPQPMPQPVAQQMQPQMQAQPQSATAPGMNPAHGQPGHRCDIAVGTPLSQPIQTKTAQNPGTVTMNPNGTVTGGNQNFKVTPTAAAQKVAPGMNPAHGQPGHRCDIAVGQPLNSPAGKGQKAAGTSAPISINSDGTVTGGDGKVKVTRTDNTAPKTDVPTLLQAPAAE